MFAFNSVSHYKFVPLFPELKKNLLQKGEVCMRTGFLWGPCPILAVTSWRRFEAKRSQERRINFSLDLQIVHFFISLLLRYEMLPHTHIHWDATISINICEMIFRMALNELLERLIRCLINLKQVQSQANLDLGIFGLCN